VYPESEELAVSIRQILEEHEKGTPA
jgi:hypothetical protein